MPHSDAIDLTHFTGPGSNEFKIINDHIVILYRKRAYFLENLEKVVLEERFHIAHPSPLIVNEGKSFAPVLDSTG